MNTIRELLTELAADAGFRDPAELALSLHLLLCGSIIQASLGNATAAERARHMTEAVMEEFRQPQAQP
jgi:hypothetical protein